jgi:competence protein ComEC
MKLPRQPFVGPVLAAASGILLADYFAPPHQLLLPSLVFALLVGALLLVRPNIRSTYIFAAVGFFVLHSVQISDTPGLRLQSLIGGRQVVANVTGVVASEPKVGANQFATFLLKLSSIKIEDNETGTDATVFARWRGHVEFGDELQLFGVTEPISAPRNPGEFDMRSYLARADVREALFVRYTEDGRVVRRGGGNPILRAAQISRSWMQQTLCRSLDDAPDVQSFLSGIVLGLRHQTPENIEEPFQQTGTLHLFAVAGLHVGIIARLLWIAAMVAQLPRRIAAAIIIPSLLFYAAITGLHVSSVRAAVMASVLLGGLFFDRKVFTLNSLAAAAFLLLCWNTNELFATGFQLSFAVVGAIVLFSDPLAKIASRWSAPDAFLPSSLLTMPRRAWHSSATAITRGASVSAAAWIGSLVLILAYFYLVAPISLLANLVIVPIAFFILAIAMLSLVSAPFAPLLSAIFNHANLALARFVLALVHFFAQLPSGHYYIAHPHWPDGARAKIDILDVGTGAAVHVTSRRHHWLFDCGSERAYERILRPYLHASGVNKIEGLVLTHGDAQHIGGALQLLREMPPTILIDNFAPDRSPVHRDIRGAVIHTGASLTNASAGEFLWLTDGVAAKILYPPRDLPQTNADDEALVVQLTTPSARLLLVSDAGERTERALLNAHVDLTSDIIVKGQHHSSQSCSDAFLDAVQPSLIIATSRDFPRSERVDDAWADRVRKRKIKLFRQDETGAVQLRFWPNEWEARAYLTREVLRRSNR